jgi:hypothetical protein
MPWFAINKPSSPYHSFSHYDNDRKALETGSKVQRTWSRSDWLALGRLSEHGLSSIVLCVFPALLPKRDSCQSAA